ncbi:hypothetical protein DPEC_G00087420 [Dallia pectoralis]|uniref:Uncharacterized protein n=1 Tax=Dallia pectoralis TaxID=75939 RepID=A0ACC2GZZ8_DALPE|nr:hypothetical protein DPEC_G00087420 [Dallia pectoralis]
MYESGQCYTLLPATADGHIAGRRNSPNGGSNASHISIAANRDVNPVMPNTSPPQSEREPCYCSPAEAQRENVLGYEGERRGCCKSGGPKLQSQQLLLI